MPGRRYRGRDPEPEPRHDRVGRRVESGAVDGHSAGGQRRSEPRLSTTGYGHPDLALQQRRGADGHQLQPHVRPVRRHRGAAFGAPRAALRAVLGRVLGRGRRRRAPVQVRRHRLASCQWRLGRRDRGHWCHGRYRIGRQRWSHRSDRQHGRYGPNRAHGGKWSYRLSWCHRPNRKRWCHWKHWPNWPYWRDRGDWTDRPNRTYWRNGPDRSNRSHW